MLIYTVKLIGESFVVERELASNAANLNDDCDVYASRSEAHEAAHYNNEFEGRPCRRDCAECAAAEQSLRGEILDLFAQLKFGTERSRWGHD